MKSAVPQAILHGLQDEHRFIVNDFTFSGGGCINSGGKLTTNHGKFFLKWNDSEKYPLMFEAEERGLKLLREKKSVRIPSVIGRGVFERHQYLLLEFIEQTKRSPGYWADLGTQLATLHKNTNDLFGLDHDNYIGALKQFNSQTDDWIDFFISRRLMVQVKFANDRAKVDSRVVTMFERLYRKLPDLLPLERPSLLHGDLWSGNVINDEHGNPVLIDPATYFGNREAELAFSRLFGGFSADFYESYHRNFPLTPGHDERIDIYNLYPLMVHVNLFGGGYLTQVVSILSRIV